MSGRGHELPPPPLPRLLPLPPTGCRGFHALGLAMLCIVHTAHKFADGHALLPAQLLAASCGRGVHDCAAVACGCSRHVPPSDLSCLPVPQSGEDLWHAYNLVREGDRVEATTFRKV